MFNYSFQFLIILIENFNLKLCNKNLHSMCSNTVYVEKKMFSSSNRSATLED